MVIIYFLDGYQTTIFAAKDGIVHSLVITYGLRPIYPTVDNPKHYKVGTMTRLATEGISYIAQFKNGKRVGPVWIGLVGDPILAQGFLYGLPDKKTGKLTGDDIVYIYPDYKTVLRGRFEDKIMKSARLAKVTTARCTDGMLHLGFSEPDPSSQVYFYDPASGTSMGSMWSVKEPLEDMLIEIGESTIPNSGQGIFAKVDIPERKVVAFYHGLILDELQNEQKFQECRKNKTDKDKASCVKYLVSP